MVTGLYLSNLNFLHADTNSGKLKVTVIIIGWAWSRMFFFKIVIWLPFGILWAILERAASLA